MGHRLSVIATRTGDDGTTGLATGTRVPKDSPRIAAIGDVDELNSALGLLATEALPPGVAADVLDIQHDLFDLGGELSMPGQALLRPERVAHLDRLLSDYNARLEPLKEFVLPGGSRAGALAHVARTICRRAERSVVALDRSEPVQPAIRQYLNRLSDLLFVLARRINQDAGAPEVLWRPGRTGGN
ncbi:cob(I)yrinic acid a,c-diamide adenosyltransferase [Pigmentiphaga sp.]|jgi:ATP:cob(I)alamin adenosyltransferase|uniref:cob(I)yrinic acid a,c-diamide adenosyltransferase n=1 Tax=Pigmentiphaga sp. TaxID=1977564 RepID=UPI0025E0D808|nr:cob(I)yrinic acid a,c-diamide adenosyltransferase [Pigmentiphaga sp.]MBX6320021.1 cob(I)yrinic acid a,c-diamide adenosyltransferase [Pigmentiphaga sp.]